MKNFRLNKVTDNIIDIFLNKKRNITVVLFRKSDISFVKELILSKLSNLFNINDINQYINKNCYNYIEFINFSTISFLYMTTNYDFKNHDICGVGFPEYNNKHENATYIIIDPAIIKYGNMYKKVKINETD